MTEDERISALTARLEAIYLAIEEVIEIIEQREVGLKIQITQTLAVHEREIAGSTTPQPLASAIAKIRASLVPPWPRPT